MRIVSLSLALLALASACKDRDSKSEGTSTSSTSAPSASATPSVTVPAASVNGGAIAIASTAAPVSSAFGPPSWLKLGAGRSIKEHIASGSNAGCYVVKTHDGDEIDCPPMASPGATIDEVDLDKGHDCPAGFAASGEDTCSRSCTKSTDCHDKNICADRQCQPKS